MLERHDRNALIAAAIILIVLAAMAFLLPSIMLRLADISLYAALAFGLLFLFCLFIILWLRARSQKRN